MWRRFIPSWRIRLSLSSIPLWPDDQDDYMPTAKNPMDSLLGDTLLQEMMSLLERDIPDPVARRNTAIILKAHIRSRYTRSLSDLLEPYIGVNGKPPNTVEEAVQVMRDAVIRIAGYDHSEGRGT